MIFLLGGCSFFVLFLVGVFLANSFASLRLLFKSRGLVRIINDGMTKSWRDFSKRVYFHGRTTF